MELHWTVKESSNRVAVFVLGWATDYRVAEHIRPHGWDVLTVYNYHAGMKLPAEAVTTLKTYSTKYLFAWSFGVWAAERLLSQISFDRTVALNGTPYPVHDLYGIEPRRMAVTIRGLRAGGMDRFNERAYGEHYERLLTALSPRPLVQNIAELEFLASSSALPYESAFRWDGAIVGERDAIFPPENMLRFWGSRAKALPLPHYPFADAQLILNELGN